MRKFWVLGLSILVLSLLAFVVWPAVEVELMKVPMTDALAYFRARNYPALRKCFTPDAEIASGATHLPVSDLLGIMQRALGDNREADSSIYFREYKNIRRHGRTVDADFQVVVNYSGEDVPYRSIPIRKTGHVVLERTGWFSWQMRRVSSEDREVRDLLNSTALLRLLPILQDGGN